MPRWHTFGGGDRGIKKQTSAYCLFDFCSCSLSPCLPPASMIMYTWCPNKFWMENFKVENSNLRIRIRQIERRFTFFLLELRVFSTCLLNCCLKLVGTHTVVLESCGTKEGDFVCAKTSAIVDENPPKYHHFHAKMIHFENYKISLLTFKRELFLCCYRY